MMTNIPIPQQIYRHFKGNLYQIISLAEHTETGEKLVIYQALYGDFRIYARPLSQFMEKLDRGQYPDASQEYRFEQVASDSSDDSKVRNSTDGQARVRKEAKEESGKDLSDKSEEEAADMQEALSIDPLVLDFLDTKSYEERLNILASLHHRITDDMINVMAMSMDIEVKEGDIEDRYTELRKCLLLYDKFECTRLR